MNFHWLTITYTTKEGRIESFERYYNIDLMLEECSESYDSLYGAGNWAITFSQN